MDGNEKDSTESRLRELEIKLTFLDDYVAEQNKTLVREIARLKRALHSLAEKTESLDGGNAAPANEKPPHW